MPSVDAKRRYIIVCPQYGASNGIRTLYALSKELEQRGYVAQMLSYGKDIGKYNFIDKVTSEMRNEDIVIYPEVICGNPLQAKNVVRYVLFYPGKNGGDQQYHSSELVFSHNKNFFDTDNILLIPYVDKTLFYDDHSIKSKDCYFVHKGGKWKYLAELEELTEINMSYPTSRNELAALLRQTRILYSYDNCSAILDEAICCGCNVKIINADGCADYSKGSYEKLTKDFNKQIERFIEITQSHRWTGEIEKARIGLLGKLYICLKLYVYILMRKQNKVAKYKWLKLLYI